MMGVLSIAPYVSVEEAIGRDVRDMADVDALDPETDGLAIIEAQRRQSYDVHGMMRAHVVGGFAELVTATREGITRKVLRRWPDRVGEKITP